MPEYDNSMGGAIFANDEKTEPKHPDGKGSCEITCPHCHEDQTYNVASWLREAGPNAKKPGQKFRSLAFRLPWKRYERMKGIAQDEVEDGKETAAPRERTAPPDDDIPF